MCTCVCVCVYSKLVRIQDIFFIVANASHALKDRNGMMVKRYYMMSMS